METLRTDQTDQTGETSPAHSEASHDNDPAQQAGTGAHALVHHHNFNQHVGQGFATENYGSLDPPSQVQPASHLDVVSEIASGQHQGIYVDADSRGMILWDPNVEQLFRLMAERDNQPATEHTSGSIKQLYTQNGEQYIPFHDRLPQHWIDGGRQPHPLASLIPHRSKTHDEGEHQVSNLPQSEVSAPEAWRARMTNRGIIADL